MTDAELPLSVLFLRLGVALALGLLIGAERGWHTRELAPGRRIAGFRTFGLIGFLGALWALLAELAGPLVLAAAFLALAAILALAYGRVLQEDKDRGATTVVASLLVFALGALAGYGLLEVAAAGSVITALLLGVKGELHRFIEGLSHDEILAVIKLLLMSVVLLPVLPDAGYGPLGALNPYEIWWMVVLIAGLSFLGYAAIKIAGPRRGIILTALLGGLASSTAITLTFSRLARGEPARRALLGGGIALASAMMFLRALAITAIVAPALLERALMPLLLAGLAASAAALALLFTRNATASTDYGLALKNPFELGTALKFGLLLAAIMVLSRVLDAWAGEWGLYALAAVSGLADVDAVTLSFASMARESGLAPAIAALGVAIAAAANTVVKITLAGALAGPRLAGLLALALLPALAAGLGGLWLPLKLFAG